MSTSQNLASEPASMDITCTNCGRPYPHEGLPARCPACSGMYDFSSPPRFDPVQVDRTQPGIWRYQHSFALPEEVKPVSLGEGSTPLLWAEALGRKVAFKCEYLNPSGSFKDRGSAVIAAMLIARGADRAVEIHPVMPGHLLRLTLHGRESGHAFSSRRPPRGLSVARSNPTAQNWSPSPDPVLTSPMRSPRLSAVG